MAASILAEARVEGLLEGFRVLDLADEKGQLCGKILGDLGAEVLKIERPGGDASRRRGPFHHDHEDPEKGLFWLANNTSKKGITLNLETARGLELLRHLVRSADFVIESFKPGYLEGLGLGYRDLELIKPEIILTSITPFGQSGPYATHEATDLTASAMGGLVRILGEQGHPPVRMSCDPQAYCQAGVHGAVGSMVAHYHRELSTQGQHVDVSMQQAVVLSTMSSAETYDLMGVNVSGTGQAYIIPRPEPLGPVFLRFIYACKDGFVVCYFVGGFGAGVKSSRALADWANEEGMALEFKEFDFGQWNVFGMSQQEVERYFDIIGEFLMTKTKEELYEGAVKRGIMLAPCATTEDIYRNRHLEARGFWQAIEHPELGDTLRYPGAPVRPSEASWRIRCRAPRIGEHNEEVYRGELGLSEREMVALQADGII